MFSVGCGIVDIIGEVVDCGMFGYGKFDQCIVGIYQ